MLNLPNALTILRILLAPVLVDVLLTRFDGSELWGLGIFLLAAITDAVDGAIARRTQSVTNTLPPGMILGGCYPNRIRRI